MSAPEKPEDFGDDVKRWIAEIDAAEKGEVQTWGEKCRKIEQRYKDEGERKSDDRRFAMLWANIETLKPAVYSRQPQPVVATRHKDRNPVARLAAEVLERCLSYSVDEYDFQQRMLDARDEYLLYARAALWVRYVPEFGADGQLAGESVMCDFINRDDFLTNKARTWQEVRWVSRRVFMSREELEQRFDKKKAALVPLDHKVSEGEQPDGAPSDLYQKATIYEVWDKASRKAMWLSKVYPHDFLDVRPDPLGLGGFFPSPMPAYGTKTTSSLIPKPDYLMYQDQAEEVDKLTARIGKLTDALKVRALYAGDMKGDLSRLMNAGDNEMIPVNDWAGLSDKGGVAKSVEWFPVNMVAEVMRGCIETRRQVIEDIYQLTGISDIVRGASDPQETLGAQQIKTQWGGLRIKDRQQELQRMARDVLRIKGEIIAERFGQDTIAKMSGVELMTEAEKAQAQQAMQLAQQQHQMQAQAAQAEHEMQAQAAVASGQEPPPAPEPPPPPEPDPEQMALLQKPSWDEVMELLRSEPGRRFNIDIETDSTIAADEAAEKERRTEFITAVSGFLQNTGPIIQMAPELTETVGQMLMFGVRGFHAGRELEDVIERGMQALAARASQPPPPAEADPSIAAKAEIEKGKAQADAELARANAEANASAAAAAHQAALQKMAADHEIKMAELQLSAQNDAASTQATLQAALQKQADDHQRKMIELEAKAQLDRETAQATIQQQANDYQYRLAELDQRTQADVTKQRAQAELAERARAEEGDGDIEGARKKVSKADREKAERDKDRAQLAEMKQIIVDMNGRIGKPRSIAKLMRGGADNRIMGAEFDDGARMGLRFDDAGEIAGTEVLQ